MSHSQKILHHVASDPHTQITAFGRSAKLAVEKAIHHIMPTSKIVAVVMAAVVLASAGISQPVEAAGFGSNQQPVATAHSTSTGSFFGDLTKLGDTIKSGVSAAGNAIEEGATVAGSAIRNGAESGSEMLSDALPSKTSDSVKAVAPVKIDDSAKEVVAPVKAETSQSGGFFGDLSKLGDLIKDNVVKASTEVAANAGYNLKAPQ